MDASEQNSALDIFMEQQTYVYITIDLSEALYPTPDYTIIKGDSRALTNKYAEVNKFPSSRQAI